jgi:hypothetical protein
MTGTRRAGFATAVLAAVLVAGSGCSAVPPGSATPTPSTTSTSAPGPGVAPDDGGVYSLLPATHPHIQRTCPVISAVHYDPEAIPAAVVDGAYICTAEPWTDAPDGTPQLVQYVDRVVQEDIAGLLAAYAVPDAPPTDGACDASLHDPLIVWLHVGGDITPVYAPRNECGAPSEAADAAYHAVELRRLLVAREKERND